MAAQSRCPPATGPATSKCQCPPTAAPSRPPRRAVRSCTTGSLRTLRRTPTLPRWSGSRGGRGAARSLACSQRWARSRSTTTHSRTSLRRQQCSTTHSAGTPPLRTCCSSSTRRRRASATVYPWRLAPGMMRTRCPPTSLSLSRSLSLFVFCLCLILLPPCSPSLSLSGAHQLPILRQVFPAVPGAGEQ